MKTTGVWISNVDPGPLISWYDLEPLQRQTFNWVPSHLLPEYRRMLFMGEAFHIQNKKGYFVFDKIEITEYRGMRVGICEIRPLKHVKVRTLEIYG